MTDLITAEAASQILRRSPRTVVRWAEQGRLAGRKLPGSTGTWLFDAQLVRAVAQTIPAKRGAPEPLATAGGQDPTDKRTEEAGA